MKDRKLTNAELHRSRASDYNSLPESGVFVVLDNIRSAHNVGSAFRTSDAFKVDGILLCGISAQPPSPQIHKTALGAENSVPWEYFQDTLSAVKKLREEGYTIVSIEQTEHALDLDNFVTEEFRRYAFIFGNEVDGVGQDVVDASDFALQIPQFGTKHSLNVSVAVGIVLWQYHLTKCHWHGH